jgi:hypothetical protein
MNIYQPTQVLVTAYPDISGVAALMAPNTLQLALNMVRAFNRSGSAVDVGIAKLFSSASFSLYTYDGSSTYSAVLPPPLAGSNPATIFNASGTIGNGFVIQSKYKSGLFGFTITQDGSSGVYTYEYWNGTAWSSLTTIAVPVYTSTGTIVTAFLPPVDWVAGGPAGLSSNLYSIRVKATTLPGASIIVNNLWAGAFLEYYASIANNTGVSLEFDYLHPYILEGGEGIMPYFGGAAAANGMTISYSTL